LRIRTLAPRSPKDRQSCRVFTPPGYYG
jgi:hypothetical protein